jgi:hypothetical protein
MMMSRISDTLVQASVVIAALRGSPMPPPPSGEVPVAVVVHSNKPEREEQSSLYAERTASMARQ